VLIQIQPMDLRLSVLPFEVQQRDVLRLETLLIPDVHADAVDEMVAVGLDDEPLLLLLGEDAQEGAELGLGSRVEVDLGLLEQEGATLLTTEAVHDDGKNLADAVADVDQIDCATPDMHLDLKRISLALAQAPDFNLGEKSRLAAEGVQSGKKLPPANRVGQWGARQNHGNVRALWSFSALNRIVGSLRAGANWGKGIRPRPDSFAYSD